MGGIPQQKGHGEKWTRKKEMAIVSLLTEKTMGEAAEKAGIAESTLFRWLQNERFQEEFQKAKQDTVAHATARLRASMTIAIDTLVDICENSQSHMARAASARTILEYGMKAHENEDMQTRLERIEASLESED